MLLQCENELRYKPPGAFAEELCTQHKSVFKPFVSSQLIHFLWVLTLVVVHYGQQPHTVSGEMYRYS